MIYLCIDSVEDEKKISAKNGSLTHSMHMLICMQAVIFSTTNTSEHSRGPRRLLHAKRSSDLFSGSLGCGLHVITRKPWPHLALTVVAYDGFVCWLLFYSKSFSIAVNSYDARLLHFQSN